jgi:hypothetical protein
MEGTITLEKTIVNERIEKELKLLRCFRQMGREMRKLLVERGLSLDIHALVKTLKRLRSIEHLAREFRVVKFDEKAVRTIRRRTESGQPATLEVPLVFRTKLPAKTSVRQAVRKSNVGQVVNTWPVTISAKVPHPPLEALKALTEHRSKFDWMELWWIPKTVHVTEVKPDPMIVGVVSAGVGLEYHFEIYRWIDEVVEDAYWAKEGY